MAYNFNTKAEEIANEFDLSGKNVLITGGYAGIGKETARVFGLRNSGVIIVGRDKTKGNNAVEELKNKTGNQNISFLEVDLSSLESIRAFADKFNKLNIPVHYLILNAGIMAVPEGKTKDGFETQFGTNFLGHFLLTNLLVPSLLKATPSRVVSLSSAGHVMRNILFSVEFNKRYSDKGITANALHPGLILTTELARHVPSDLFGEGKALPFPNLEKFALFSFSPKTIEQGAATTVYCALSPNAQGGKFYDDCAEKACEPHASDPEAAKRAWDLAANLVKL